MHDPPDVPIPGPREPMPPTSPGDQPEPQPTAPGDEQELSAAGPSIDDQGSLPATQDAATVALYTTKGDSTEVQPSADEARRKSRGILAPVAALRRALSQSWRWVKEHSDALQILIGVAALVVGIIALYAQVSSDDSKDGSLIVSKGELVSSDSHGVPADYGSGRPSLDRSGRYAAFTSNATNLYRNATNGYFNIYRKDRFTKQTDLISVSADGGEANGQSQYPIICSDGRYVAFASTATNLLDEGPTLASDSDRWRVYVRDTLSSTTYLVSVSASGGDPDGDSVAPRFNADCTKVVFESEANNLVAGDLNGTYDVFIRTVLDGPILLVSSNTSGQSADEASTHADIAPDGTMVAFTSWATDLTPAATTDQMPEIWIRDLRTNQTIPISTRLTDRDGDIQGFSWPDFSSDGQYLIFRSLTNASDPTQRGRHVFVWDVTNNRGAITLPDRRTPTGWGDACVVGTNNGTKFSPEISGYTPEHPYRILFTVPRDGTCRLVLRDLSGNDTPLSLRDEDQEILEPALNDSGDVLAWAVAGSPQLVYACVVDNCSGTS